MHYSFVPADTAAEDALNAADGVLAFITAMADNITNEMTLNREAVGGLCTVIDGVRALIKGASVSCGQRYQDGLRDGRELAAVTGKAKRDTKRQRPAARSDAEDAAEVAAILDEALGQRRAAGGAAPKLTEIIPPKDREDAPDDARDEGRATA